MNNYPDWVLKYKEKGTAVSKKDNKCYYLYRVHGRWDPKMHRTQKVTDCYLGKITPGSHVLPKHVEVVRRIKRGNITVKQYEATNFPMESNRDITDMLKNHFPNDQKEIFMFAVFRLIRNSPIKNLEFLNATSFISEGLEANISDRWMGCFLRNIGNDRALITRFMNNFIDENCYLEEDMTHVFSLSENVISSMVGYNSKRDYAPKVTLLYLFNLTRSEPVYFRTLIGSTTSLSSFIVSIRESGANDVVLIGDNGFYFDDNVKSLEKEGNHYILLLKKDSNLIDYGILLSGNMRKFGMHFIF